MRIIISPAKKMKVDTDSLPVHNFPAFLEETEAIVRELQSKPSEELQRLWKCNDKIAMLNVERLQNMELRCNLTPAVLAYVGIQYQYMAPNVFTAQEYDYIQEHLRILSGFYGVLRPFDGVTPYRLEMQAKLKIGEVKDLYSFWNSKLADNIFKESDCIVNLASREYSICISPYLRPDIHFITCVFGEEKDGKIVEKGTMCKMARGEMVRYMAENQITKLEDICSFDRLNYVFDAARSDKETYVFVKRGKAPCSLD